MRIFGHMEETWQVEYFAKRSDGWLDALTSEAYVPIAAWRRLRRAEQELQKARDAIKKMFNGEDP